MNRLTVAAWIVLALAILTAFPIAAKEGGLAAPALLAAAVPAVGLTLAPARPALLRPAALLLFLAADGTALALAATGTPLRGASLGDLALPLAHALLAVAFVECAHAGNRARDLRDGPALLTAPFLRQAALALPVLLALLAGVVLLPALLGTLLPAAVAESYELAGPSGLVLAAVVLAALVAAGAALARTVADRRARAAAPPPTQEESA